MSNTQLAIYIKINYPFVAVFISATTNAIKHDFLLLEVLSVSAHNKISITNEIFVALREKKHLQEKHKNITVIIHYE